MFRLSICPDRQSTENTGRYNLCVVNSGGDYLKCIIQNGFLEILLICFEIMSQK